MDLWSPFAQQDRELHDMLSDFDDFELCAMLHIEPDKLDEQPADRVSMWRDFMKAKRKHQQWKDTREEERWRALFSLLSRR